VYVVKRVKSHSSNLFVPYEPHIPQGTQLM
jgi:hypothetical protein